MEDDLFFDCEDPEEEVEDVEGEEDNQDKPFKDLNPTDDDNSPNLKVVYGLVEVEPCLVKVGVVPRRPSEGNPNSIE